MARTPADVVVVGDGPTGLTAALFLAKNGQAVHVLGVDGTAMHKALLRNYPGRPETPGPELMAELRRQCEAAGAHLHDARVQAVARDGDGFVATAEEGRTFAGRHLVLATGKDRTLADALGLAAGPDGVQVDHGGRTSLDRVYAGGWLTRGAKIQAAISVGDGAAIALEILSREKGKPFHDFDVLPASR